MEWSLEQCAGIYAKYVGWIDRQSDNWETFTWEALIIRSDLHERWSELTEGQRRQVQAADDLLVANYRHLQEILPGAATHSRSEWWWFLHEGPQVRAAGSALPG